MSQWQQLQQRYNGLQIREKRLIFFGSLALGCWLMLILILEPVYLRFQQSQTQVQQVQQQLQALQEQASLLQQQLSLDINQPLHEQLAQQQQLMQSQNAQLQPYRQQFMTGQQTVLLLQDLLGSLQPLQLVSLTTAPAQPLLLPGQQPDETPALYRHVTTLVVSGEYGQLQQMLLKLEALPWLLQWQQVEYQVQQHPKAQLMLQLATVSEHESYIRF
ncbi:type II secretion system protein GspM [Alishewanella tabrizica]|uniref:MSHA biogenesis protein MshJ n=1 Tax=Alishewanella tabrizica TaxID=671278 RepID=A0ABQ2WCL6_9ALTE|nr:type II secretion system protein GspM [Alishewanella tabrizica]GGW48658.1 hypothetical protein GCM10008111_00410 [Alishewanella tabrizica]